MGVEGERVVLQGLDASDILISQKTSAVILLLNVCQHWAKHLNTLAY